MANNSYNDQVFINCPFDGQYSNMFRACVFTILDAGFIPRCSKEVDNATQFRLAAIVDLVKDCRYGVHDLSRVELDSDSNLPRFNMPFELGIFHGAKNFGGPKQKSKQCLVLEKEEYRYQKFISDISGIDVKSHKNSQKAIIHAIRDWLLTASRRTTIPAGADIHGRFGKFQSQIRRACKQRSQSYDAMTFIELVNNMTDWLRVNQVEHEPIFGSKN
jgi:hypothetical protein